MKRLHPLAEQFLYRRGTAVAPVKTRVNCRVRRGLIPSRLNVGHQAVGFRIAAAGQYASFSDASETQSILRSQLSADARASRKRFMSAKRGNARRIKLRDALDGERLAAAPRCVGEEQSGDPCPSTWSVKVASKPAARTIGESSVPIAMVMMAAARSSRQPTR